MNKDHLWKAILGEIELQISRPTFKTFFSPIHISSITDNVITLGCPNSLVANTIESRYYALIKQIADRHLGASASIVFTVETPPKPQSAQSPSSFLPLFSLQSSEGDIEQLMKKAHLNPQHTFENFAVSGSNQMAYAAATAVAKTPGKAYNPLFLWGGVGVGKTHLMHAIGHAILHRKAKSRIIFCMGEEFTNDIIDAIQTKSTKQFKQKYRSADVLLIDDVQFIAGKNAVQEEFFHTFNTIHREGGQIVLTSDKPPNEISKLEDRLRSRFEGGLTIDVSPPDFELRCAILRIKAEQKTFTLPMDIAQFIAANITDTRKLEGTLVRLMGEAQMKKLPVSLSLAKQILGKRDDDVAIKRTVSPVLVMKIVSSRYTVSESLLKGSKRDKDIATPRQIIMYILRTELGVHLVEIGDFLGGRDHTTIMHGVDKISKELLINEKLREDVLWIKQKLLG